MTQTMEPMAPLQNVGICLTALDRAMSRPRHLPGLVVFHGPSGWGKSTGAVVAANAHRAYYVEGRSTWTRKAMLTAMLKEMGIQPGRTIPEMADQAAEQLALSGRPLIIDEMDHVVERGLAQIVKDIYEASRAAIMLIGEEGLPGKLERWERFHGRILNWVAAQPASLEDAAELARFWCPGVRMGADLLRRIHDLSQGSARRICVNLELARERAAELGLDTVDLAALSGLAFYTGRAARRDI
ncbi:AAA family ATPase [Desulfovibrio aminophilus]|uniref:AAA family ATPase n=1 Tax=Desulfovibrio aminophilus TaxID=81425 RepID=UPI00048477DF|nr:AAA family ATPase [Desulfovibrio aminophilus]